MPSTPEIIVVDPDLGSRADAKRLMELAHLTVVGEAGYGIEAVSAAKEHPPDLFIVSMEEPVARALHTIESLADAVPAAPTIVYSSMSDAASVRRAMVAGARDYLIKPARPEDVSRAAFGILEQEERKRARLAGETVETAARGTILTIFGAKGGIGKTTIATNLSTSLRRITESSVVLVDMDTRFGDVAIMMDIGVETSIADLAQRIDTLNRDNIKDYLVSHHTGVSILPAPIHPSEWRHLTPEHIEKIVDLLAQTHDFVIIDTPGTFNELIASALELANLILLVTSMDIASIKDTALALEMLRSAAITEDKVKLTINHATSANSIHEEDVERVLKYPVFWRIPYDLSVSSSTQLGQPVVITKPYARVSRSISELAHSLSGTRVEKRGFLNRFLSR